MTAAQKRLFFALCFAIALTRFAAVAPSLFDLDEALFVLGVRDYDVTLHHPHPPGYPLFVGAAKALHQAGVEPFRALQAVTLLSSLFTFPVVFWLARELDFDFQTAAAGAAIFSFLPNVWLYAGTAFSDLPATVLALAASALLLRGRRDSRAYVAGALALGLTAAIRPAHLLIGLVPALLATAARLRARSYRSIAAGALAGAVVIVVSYGAAGAASGGVARLADAVQTQSRWVREVDSWRNPGRPPLGEMAVAFVLHPMQHRDVLNVLATSAIVSLAAAVWRRRLGPLATAAMFVPLAAMSILQLNPSPAARYAIAIMPAHAILAADGFRVVFRHARAQLAFSCIVVAFLVYLALPSLREQRTTVPPPMAALRHVAAHAAPSEPVYIYPGLRPLAQVVLPGRDVRDFAAFESVPAGAWVVDAHLRPGAANFRRRRDASWRVLRQRNFEASALRK